MSFEFQKAKGNHRTSHPRTGLGKPTPSKWDDAQKWLVSFSGRVEKSQSKATPRNSNADDRRLIAVPKREDYSSGEEVEEGNGYPGTGVSTLQYEVETKNVDCDHEDSIWRINKHVDKSTSVVRSVSVRDTGTEMTPIASQEPSRTATPIRATTPVARSPISSGSSTPIRCQNRSEGSQAGRASADCRSITGKGNGATGRHAGDGEDSRGDNVIENSSSDQDRKSNPLETRAVAWDEAERTKYMARYKREEVKIEAWENHEKRKAEMKMKRAEAKAERQKSRAHEMYTTKLASSRRIAEEKRAYAEAKLNEKAVRTSERADYIRRTGHLPSSFSFKLPSFCW